MTPSQKPEWIEIAEKDNSVLPHKVSKGLPVLALVVTASIIGMGSIFAQTSEESPASAVEIIAPAVFATSKISFAPTATSTTSSIENPSIGTMPTEEEDDDDDIEDDIEDDDSDEDDLDDSDEDEGVDD